MKNYDLQKVLDACINYDNMLYESLKKKRERMYKFVINSLSLDNKVYFCTFTFNNDYLINNNFIKIREFDKNKFEKVLYNILESNL